MQRDRDKRPSVRVLGIETSSRRGSVALWDGATAVSSLAHEEPSSHAERMLPLVEQILAEAGWPKTSLDRIAVGRGPGSFVGLRVGIALAEGLGLGLGRPVVGVPSLAAMTAAVPAEVAGTRVAVVDARRGELFIHAAAANGDTRLDAEAVARGEFMARLVSLASELVLVGEAAREVAGAFRTLAGPELDLPHALSVARLATLAAPAQGAVLPLYVRGPGATAQNLPPSPFGGA